MRTVVVIEDDDRIRERLRVALEKRLPDVRVLSLASLASVMERREELHRLVRASQEQPVWVIDLLLHQPLQDEVPPHEACEGLQIIWDLFGGDAAAAARVLVVTYYTDSEKRKRLVELGVPDERILAKGADLRAELVERVAALLGSLTASASR